MGASLRKFGGRPVYELFNDLIATPLDLGPYHWNIAPNGEGYLGGGAYIRPRDILKVGAMYAASEVWNGKRIVPEAGFVNRRERTSRSLPRRPGYRQKCSRTITSAVPKAITGLSKR